MLDDDELELRRDLKLECLGLASLARTIACQRSRIRFLEEGDANTKFFHLQACHRNRKNQILALKHKGQWFIEEEAKSDSTFEFYNDILGKPFARDHAIELEDLLPRLQLDALDACFTAYEISLLVQTALHVCSTRPPGRSSKMMPLTRSTHYGR